MADSRLLALLVIGLFALSCGSGSGGGASKAAPADHVAKVQAWRDKHEADYRRDWVSIAGLHFLMTGTYTVGSGQGNDIVLTAHVPETIGRLVVADGTVTYEPASGMAVMQQGKPVAGSIVLKEPSGPPKDEIVIGDVRLVVHVSGERLSLRVRDPHGELATGFLGFTWFPIQPAYRVVGRFIRDAEPRQMSVLNTFNDVDTYPTEGVVEFQLNGQTLRLRPFTTRPKRFYFVFRDASSGQETYETARFLYSDLLDDGTTVLDFNEAYNPPCAFNPYTTCPIPMRENILPVKILAGEKAYPVEVKLPSEKS
ncbi:MAG TPA: DUF1684 domain-containing protein [Vicinamibacterales bacterium]|jgi:uncharacterized protein (DUF1684 family)